MKMTLAVPLVLLLAAFTAAIPTVENEREASAVLRELASTGDGIPKMVRFAFHSTLFGAHGCLDLDEPDNAGLGPIKASIDALYDANTYNMSRADFWALAGVVALDEANGPSVEMRYGREDLPTSCVGAGTFPNGLLGMEENMRTLGAQYGLTEREVVVLLGAHTLGRCRPENSGFVGPWTGDQDRFDNDYYEELLDDDWTQEVVPQPDGPSEDKRQWNQGPASMPRRMMLNTDMSLLYDLNVTGSASGLSATCPADPTGCPRAATASVVDEMAGSNRLFRSEFAVVFQKMLEVNVSDTLEAAISGAARAAGHSLSALALAACVAAAGLW